MINIILSFVLPALWIFYFLRKDKHPEPIAWLFFAFVLGAPAVFLSYLTEDLFSLLITKNFYFYLATALIEEFFKFLVVWVFIFPQRVVDEPIDAMIYMMVTALGFASTENIFYLKRAVTAEIWIIIFRFLGANFLHILASGLIGYGYGYFMKTRRTLPLAISFLSGVILHFLYNFVIIQAVTFILIFPILWSTFLIVLSELDYLVFINERGTRKTS